MALKQLLKFGEAPTIVM